MDASADFSKVLVILFCRKCYSVCARPNTDLWSDHNILEWETVNPALLVACCFTLDIHLDYSDGSLE